MPCIDEFYYKQPPLDFVNELKTPYYKEKNPGFGRNAEKGEVSVNGVYLDKRFEDKEGLLETVYSEFERFSKLYGIGGSNYPIIIEKGITECFEAYEIRICDEKCTVIAADTEGVRRALFYIMDEIVSREGAVLPRASVKRRPYIRTRITRGFFSPTNRPPKNGDELYDSIDYYPDEYLNRLAHDGTNGIWIYTRFSDLLSSEYVAEYGAESDKRLNKLRAVVDKCARYGVKVYVFGIEPMNMTPPIADRHADMHGADKFAEIYHPICPSTEKGAAYIIEMTERLFRAVPNLGGFINITQGERMTTCINSPNFHTCPRCSKKSKGRALADAVELMREGMRRAGSNAEMISWTYGNRDWAHEDIKEYVRCAPSDVMLMQNFDDMGYPIQLGKTRQAVDYWLSYVGPSPMFEITAKEANSHGKHMFAKMQVCSSHELATVPYIPAPGLLFDKFKAARALGVEGVMECWYFGNYPSMMSKAAGELSFMASEDFDDKDAFLLSLLAKIYGISRAESALRAIRLFEDSYSNYPVNVMFSYYGPMHDGVVWKLHLKPEDIPLPRTWQLLDPPTGDRIHECLWSGHTLDEAIILSERMKNIWAEGVKLIDSLRDTELYTLSEAIGILFASGYNILKFYKLREELGEGRGDALSILDELKDIVLSEMENSSRMIEICRKDSRLGYHSEAEGFKFFPEKLEDRISYLKKLLDTEFSEVAARIKSGLAPLAFYSEEGKADAYALRKCGLSAAEKSPIPETNAYVSLSYDDDNIYLLLDGIRSTMFEIAFEYKLLHPSPEIVIRDGNKRVGTSVEQHQSLFGKRAADELEKYSVTTRECGERVQNLVTVSRSSVGWIKEAPMRLRVAVFEDTDVISDETRKFWIRSDEVAVLLGKPSADPKTFKWLIPESCET